MPTRKRPGAGKRTVQTAARVGIWLTIVWACLLSTGLAWAANNPAQVTVMSFNIRYGTADDGPNSWPARRKLVYTVITDHQPDILGVQECLWNQGEDLGAALPAYQMTGYGRNDGARSGEMCAIFTRRERYRVLDRGVFWLSETPDQVGSKGWDAALPRIATWVKLLDRSCPMDTVLVFNTHFDHLGSQARASSALLLRRRMAGEGTFHGFSGEATRGRIDWILATPSLAAIDAGIEHREWNGRFPSDHFPVWAVLFELDCSP